ncbi:MAG: DUF2071 domain-containing protein [Chloroflexi bacterium]|nr:DUF2071 domain-containing protein [Chloroflexota bacterium]
MFGERPFLTAKWQYLLMLNYEIDPAVLDPLVPYGTELDLWDGKAIISIVGFMFKNTRLLGMAIPFHQNFEEVNLRFYVRRACKPGDHAEEDPRRGVVFVREIVPRPWVARVANIVCGENYIALPMRHTIEEVNGTICPQGLVEYSWRYRGRLNRLGGLAAGEPHPIQAGSEEEFIAEHYWGYSRQGKKRTGVYRIEHPQWRIRQVEQPYLLCDVKRMYGETFEPFLRRRPRSAFLAEGSPVTVYTARRE